MLTVWGIVAGGFVVATHAAPALAAGPGRRLFPTVRRVAPGRRVVLTFDDGPHPEATPALLDVLDACGVKATFFCVGEQAERAPGLVRAIADRGHEVACHGYHHRNLLIRGPRATWRDLVRARAVLEDACGAPVSLFRPPYGVFNAAAWQACALLGWRRVLWSRWTRDWEPRATVTSIVHAATEGLQDGEIVLLHDADTYSAPGSHLKTIAAIPQIVATARRLGLEPARLGDALEGR